MSNLHRDLNEANKHTAKGFPSGASGSACIRNENGVQEFEKPYGLPPAINFVDGNASPPTVVNGDIYVLIDLGNGALNAAWTTVPTVAYGDWVKRNTVWLPRKPQHGSICFNKADSTNYYFDGTEWIASGASLGKIAIYDTSGIPTFYDTIQAAVAVGGLIHLFANITTTSTINMVQGTAINLNGFTITMSNDDATNLITFTGTAGGYTGKPFFNGRILRNGRALNSSGYVVLYQKGAGATTYNIDWSGVEVESTYGNAHVNLDNNCLFELNNVTTKSYNGCFYFSEVAQNSYIKNANLFCTVVGPVYKTVVGNTMAIYNSTLFTVNGRGVNGGGFVANKCTISSVTGVAGNEQSTFIDCTLQSGQSWGTYNATAEGCIITSSQSYGVYDMTKSQDNAIKSATSNAVYAFQNYTQVRGIIESGGNANTLEHTNAGGAFKLTGVTVINTGTGHGVGGANTNSVYKNCDFIIADGTKNAISAGTTPRWMQCNFSANLTNPTAALVNAQVNTADAYGNIQEG